MVCREPGIGKTALLKDLIGSATGFRVVRAVGVQSKIKLAFAALRQLCGPMLEQPSSPDALGAAFRLSAADAPDRFLVGPGALSLLFGGGRERCGRM